MFKRLLALLFLWPVLLCAQTGHRPAIDPASSDAVQYVSLNGNDSNSGLSWGEAKLTWAAGITAACTGSKIGHVYLGAGTFNITSNLNLTGLNQGCVIEGVGAYATVPGPTSYNGTVLQINFAGASTVGIDISSVIALTMRNLVISCGTSISNAPNTCLLHGRTSGSNAIQDIFDHVFLVGYSPNMYYNYRGEQARWINSSTLAEYATTGTPVTISYANTAAITSPNVTFGGVASMTAVSFDESTTITSQATAAGSKLIYLDEGSGIIASITVAGFANLAGSNETLIGDTSGATGSILDLKLAIASQSNSLSTNQIMVLAGNAYLLHVTGTATAGATITPFAFAGIARTSTFDFYLAIGASTSCFTVGADATGSDIQLDTTCNGHITAPLAKSIVANGVTAGAPFQITDMGTCTMASGACSAQTFPSGRTYTAAPKIWLTWTGTGTCTGLLKYTDTTTTITPASSVGTDTCQVNWFAFGN